MAITVGYKDTFATKDYYFSDNAYVPNWSIKDRLATEAKIAFDLFPSLKYLGDFMQTAWLYAPKMPSTSRISISRISQSCAKIVSAFQHQLPDAHSILTDLYLAEIQAQLHKMNWWMINHQRLATHQTIEDGGVVIELSPVGFESLNDIEQWQVVENLIYSGVSTTPFDTNLKLQRLLSGITFVAKRTK